MKDAWVKSSLLKMLDPWWKRFCWIFKKYYVIIILDLKIEAFSLLNMFLAVKAGIKIDRPEYLLTRP